MTATIAICSFSSEISLHPPVRHWYFHKGRDDATDRHGLPCLPGASSGKSDGHFSKSVSGRTNSIRVGRSIFSEVTLMSEGKGPIAPQRDVHHAAGGAGVSRWVVLSGAAGAGADVRKAGIGVAISFHPIRYSDRAIRHRRASHNASASSQPRADLRLGFVHGASVSLADLDGDGLAQRHVRGRSAHCQADRDAGAWHRRALCAVFARSRVRCRSTRSRRCRPAHWLATSTKTG